MTTFRGEPGALVEPVLPIKDTFIETVSTPDPGEGTAVIPEERQAMMGGVDESDIFNGIRSNLSGVAESIGLNFTQLITAIIVVAALVAFKLN